MASLSSGLVTFEFSQHPDSVKVGGKVEVVCKATSAEGKNVHYFSWTDAAGADINGSYSTRPGGEFVLTVDESKLDKSKVVFCVASVGVGGQQKQENDSYTVHVAGESCMWYNMELCGKHIYVALNFNLGMHEYNCRAGRRGN